MGHGLCIIPRVDDEKRRSDRKLAAMVFDCIVVASHLRYDGVWQRPHHLVSRFARRVPVLFVEEPFFAKRDADTIERGPEVDVLRPQRKARPATMFYRLCPRPSEHLARG